MVRGGKVAESPMPGMREGGMANGAAGSSRSASGSWLRSGAGTSGVCNCG